MKCSVANIAFSFSGNMDKRIFILLIVLVAFTVEAKKKILKKKLNQLKGEEIETTNLHTFDLLKLK